MNIRKLARNWIKTFVYKYYGKKVPLGKGFKIQVWDQKEYIQKNIINGCYEPEVSIIISNIINSSDCFYDIGANIGFYSLLTASLGCEVHAFEPVSRIYQHLVKNIRSNRYQNRIKANNIAISDKNGTSTIYVAQRKDDGSHSLIPGIEGVNIVPESVATQTLDDYIRSGNTKPSIIKIDVEGAEELVFNGGKDILQKDHPIIIFETGDRFSNSVKVTSGDAVNTLKGIGYLIFKLNFDNQRIFITQDYDISCVKNYLAIFPNSERMNIVKRYITLV